MLVNRSLQVHRESPVQQEQPGNRSNRSLRSQPVLQVQQA